MPLGAPIHADTPPYKVLEPHDILDSLWAGIPELGPVLVEGLQPPYPAASAIMVFTAHSRWHHHCQQYRNWQYVLSTNPEEDQGEVRIMLPNEWVFSVPEQPLPLRPGKWEWSFVVTDTRGEYLRTHHGSIVIRV